MNEILLILLVLYYVPTFVTAAFAVVTRDAVFYQKLFNVLFGSNIMIYDISMGIDNILNELKKGMYNHVFTDDVLYDIADELSEYPCYFWMAYPLAQKRCSKNVIYYSSFVPMMISCIYNYLFFYYSWSSISYRFSKSKYCCLCCRR